MPPLDRSRFVYSLAGAMIAGEWNARALRSALQIHASNVRVGKPRLASRILAAFSQRPAFAPLVAFLRADAAFQKALNRAGSLSMRIGGRQSQRRHAMGPLPVRLTGIVIPALPTETALARWLSIDSPKLRWYADLAGRNRRHAPGGMRPYRYRWVSRRAGLPRLLEIPKLRLKELQRRILSEILDPVPAHPAAHGFRRGRSIITNASAHCGKRVVLRFDLADFFPSVSSARVYRIFRTLGYPSRIAALLMGLCTTQMPADVWLEMPGRNDGAGFPFRQTLITRHLPQGAPTSPAVANLAALRLDRRLAGLAAAAGVVYTRYADDLTFSGSVELARSRKRLATIVAVIADEEGFRLNHRKTRIMRAGVRQHVTGVVVNVHPNISREDYDRLRAILTNCVRHGPASQNRDDRADFRAHLAGKIAQVRSINAVRGARLAVIFSRIRWEK